MSKLEYHEVRGSKLSISYLCQLMAVSRKGYYKHAFVEEDEEVKASSVLHYCRYVREKLPTAGVDVLQTCVNEYFKGHFQVGRDWLYNFEHMPMKKVKEILAETIQLYNTARPHQELKMKTPMQMLIPEYPNPLTVQSPKKQEDKEK